MKRKVKLYIQEVDWAHGGSPEVEVTTHRITSDKFTKVKLIEVKEIEIEVPEIKKASKYGY